MRTNSSLGKKGTGYFSVGVKVACGAVEKPFFKETFSINLLSPPGRGMR